MQDAEAPTGLKRVPRLFLILIFRSGRFRKGESVTRFRLRFRNERGGGGFKIERFQGLAFAGPAVEERETMCMVFMLRWYGVI